MSIPNPSLSRRRQSLYWILISLVFAALALFLILQSAAAAGRRAAIPGVTIQGNGDARAYHASLSGANEVPAVNSLASGRAVLALSADMSTLYYRIFVSDIEDISAAHIHLGGPETNGPIEHWLYDSSGVYAQSGPFGPGDPISGTLAVTMGQVTELVSGNYYLNVHTADQPAGEIRGQIQSFSLPGDYNALLTGANEIPPVASDAVGLGQFTLVSTDTLNYEVHVRDIMSVTAAHIHKGASDENGAVVFTLFDGIGVFDPEHPISGSVTLDAENLLDLLTGSFYVNVHTSDHVAGEIRGQIGGASVFHADLSGGQELPPVNTQASGRGVLALGADASDRHYRLSVDEITDIAAAHIHQGSAGETGPVIFTLFDGTGMFDPDNPISDTISVTPAHVLDLISGNFYINVHTAVNQSGEIRGQIGPFNPPDHLSAWLSGANEVPPEVTEAGGFAQFTLDSDLNILHYQIGVTNVMSITAAHLHQGAAGQNGPIKHWLYDSAGTNAPDGPFDPDHPVGGCLNLNAWDLVDLLTGYYYVNVHTENVPSGEMRGQVIEPKVVYLPTAFK